MTKAGGLGGFSNSSAITIVGTDSFAPLEKKSSAWLIFASIFALISLTDLLLNFLRQTSRTNHDFENLSAIETATLPLQGQRDTIIDNDNPDAGFTVVHADPSMDIRRRTGQTSRTNAGFENPAPIEIATLPHQGQKDTIIVKDPSDAWSTAAHTGIRRRTGRKRGNQYKGPVIVHHSPSPSARNFVEHRSGKDRQYYDETKTEGIRKRDRELIRVPSDLIYK